MFVVGAGKGQTHGHAGGECGHPWTQGHGGGDDVHDHDGAAVQTQPGGVAKGTELKTIVQ